MKQGSPVRTLLGYSLLALAAILVTCAAFAVFVPGPDRGTTFYVALSVVCAAELVLFAHLAHSALARWATASELGAVRIQVHVLIAVWLLLAIVAAVIISHPENQDTLFADRVLIVYLIVTFCFFAATYFLYSKHFELAKASQHLATERNAVQQFIADIDDVLEAVRQMGERQPDQAIAADRTQKKLETVRSDITSVVVSERQARGGVETQGWLDRFAEEVDKLAQVARDRLGSEAADPAGVLAEIEKQVEVIRRHLRSRPGALTV